MLGLGVLLAAAVVAVLGANSPLRFADVVQPLADDTSVQYRLPNNTFPISYNLAITTNVHLDDFNFNGVVSIRFRAITASRTITVHHRQLTIGTHSLRRADDTGNTAIALNPPTYDAQTEFLNFTLTNTDLVPNAEYILTINYNGILRTDEAGFYRSSYISDSGSRVWLATTHFEATDARHAFPCYDEPAHRAKFTIAITHGIRYSALSNSPAVSFTDSDDGLTRTTTFAETPSTIPTYIIAFVVSDFSFKELATPKINHRIFARPNEIQNADFGLETGVTVLKAFEDYFGIDFTFVKLDQAAIPEFLIGAMENWGLVLYREDFLLYSEARHTFINRRNVARLVVHELAHQWLGNLVTPKWWSYVWLKEGFATLYESHATDWIFPEWKMVDTFVFAYVQNVFVFDAQPTVRPMTHYAESPRDVTNLFDSIAYTKSGCVLHMMLNALTEDTFKRGLIGFLNDNTNSTAAEVELFSQLEQAVRHDNTLSADYNVATIFTSWTRQAGFPVVSVERGYNNGTINLSQERYLTVPETTQSPSLWWIPYNYASANSANFNVTSASAWFSTRTTSFVLPNLQAEEWFLLNKRQSGYYRVKYDLENYRLLSEALISNMNQIHLTSRSQLIDDLFDFARTERLGYDVVFDLIKYLEHELEYVPWASAFRGLELVDRLYSGNENFDRYAAYLQRLLAHLYSDAGLIANPNEHHFRKEARNQAIRWSCHYGNADCLHETQVAVENYLTRNVAIHQDHRAFVLCNGIRNANASLYQALSNRLISETDPIERDRLIVALTCHSDSTVVQTLLQTSISQNDIFKTAAERYRVFFEVSGINTNGTSLSFDFLLANLDNANRVYGQNNVNSAILRLATFVNSPSLTQQFDEIVAAASQKEYIRETTLLSGATTVANNQNWISRNSPVIEDWIFRNGSSHVMVSSVLIIALSIMLQLFRF